VQKTFLDTHAPIVFIKKHFIIIFYVEPISENAKALCFDACIEKKIYTEVQDQTNTTSYESKTTFFVSFSCETCSVTYPSFYCVSSVLQLVLQVL
jgi:hypothetical protein